jgi:hypothetical protein
MGRAGQVAASDDRSSWLASRVKARGDLSVPVSFGSDKRLYLNSDATQGRDKIAVIAKPVHCSRLLKLASESLNAISGSSTNDCVEQLVVEDAGASIRLVDVAGAQDQVASSQHTTKTEQLPSERTGVGTTSKSYRERHCFTSAERSR